MCTCHMHEYEHTHAHTHLASFDGYATALQQLHAAERGARHKQRLTTLHAHKQVCSPACNAYGYSV